MPPTPVNIVYITSDSSHWYERSFSKLKLIKNYLRTSMNQDRLCDLAMISIENEVCDSLDIKKVINDFAEIKVRKKCL